MLIRNRATYDVSEATETKGEDKAAAEGGGVTGGDVERERGNIGEAAQAAEIKRVRPYGRGKQKRHGVACLNGVIGPLSAKHHVQIDAQLFVNLRSGEK